MIFFHTIKVDLVKFLKGTKTAAEKFAVAFEHIWGKSPAVLQQMNNFIGQVKIPVLLALEAVDPAAEPEVAEALQMTQTAIAALQATATAANSGQSLLTNMSSVAATIPTLLSALEVKNPQVKANIEHTISIINLESKVLIPVIQTVVNQVKTANTNAAPIAPIPAPAGV